MSEHNTFDTSEYTKQGEFSSNYTAFLTDLFNSQDVRDWFQNEYGIDLGDPAVWDIELDQNNGDEDGPVPHIEYPEDYEGDIPTLEMFAALFAESNSDIFTWEAGGGKNTVTHERYYISEFNLPGGDENLDPEADPINLGVTETPDHPDHEDYDAELGDDPDNETVDLLVDANATDPDGDDGDLFVVDGSVRVKVDDDEYEDLPDYITYEDGVLTIDKNHPDLDALVEGQTHSLTIEYAISDLEGGTTTNTADLTITGTADQFMLEGEWSGMDSFTTDSADGSFSVSLTGTHTGWDDEEFDIETDGFDFSGTATIEAVGDYNRDHDVQGEYATVSLEDGEDTNDITLGGTEGTGAGGSANEPGGSNYPFTDEGEESFFSEDNQIDVSYDNNDEVGATEDDPGTITVTVNEYDYWI